MEVDLNKLYEIKQLGYFEAVEYEFSRNFVKYIQTYNRLDQNIGFTIACLTSCTEPTLAFPMLSKLTTHKKMCVLQKKVRKKFFDTNPKLVGDYDEWFGKASTTRTERNKYIHGCWELAGCITETPILFSPTNWNLEKTDRRQQKFSLKEFKSIVGELENICREFGNLRRKYQLF